MKKIFCILLTASLAVSLVACQRGKLPIDGEPDGSATTTENPIGSDIVSDPPPDDYDPTDYDYDMTFYSDGIDNFGYWEGLHALDYVELLDYSGMEFPYDVHTISNKKVTAKLIDFVYYLQNYMSIPLPDDFEKITDREIVDNDAVNIDYIGLLDGEEFENTQGNGTDVIIGMTKYIPGFLPQLIGHKPGDTFDLKVTFPDPYLNALELSGKEVVFKTTVNYISEMVFTDKYVEEYLSDFKGWKTVEDMFEDTRKDMRDESINDYIRETFRTDSKIEVPQILTDLIEEEFVRNMKLHAIDEGMLFDYFIEAIGISGGVEGLKEHYRNENEESAQSRIVFQAIAEEMELKVTEEEINEFLIGVGFPSGIAMQEDYGLPYLAQATMCEKIIDYILDNAVYLEE
ncbi:MAG: FKBP-type peptidyl-prolyl cis-trans isomerase [Oscillospiraceae bacterium]|nr:FKBP-type peptidyl-prolyl cis-trans isomerase [Oscillospiraceae bacterium]